MTMWLQDVKYSFKSLMRRPALTTTSVLSLAIGLGGALAIFAAAHAVLFRPLPFVNPDRLVALEAMVQRDTLEPRAFSVPDFIDYRDATAAVIPHVAAWDTVTFTLRADGPGSRTAGEMVSASYFDILGIRPVAGNLFDARDVADSAPAMLIGESVWERVFARDPAAIGRTVLADEQPFTIVGVMPQSFRGLSDNAELWVPFAVHDALVPRNFWDGRGRSIPPDFRAGSQPRSECPLAPRVRRCACGPGGGARGTGGRPRRGRVRRSR
jgi:hypothetical protein